MAVFVANESGAADVDEVRLAALARFVLDAMKVNPLAELSVMLVEAKAMTDLHVRYMGEDGPTDVLSFPQDEAFDASWSESVDDDPTTLLGDVVLCPDVARSQAEQAGHPFERELHLLCAHGILHLLGFDHAEPEEEREMWKVQTQLLTSWDAALAAGSSAPLAASGVDAGTGSTAGAGATPRDTAVTRDRPGQVAAETRASQDDTRDTRDTQDTRGSRDGGVRGDGAEEPGAPAQA